jgi:hypothetical protein
VLEQLQARFDHVYTPRTQPWHEQFPLDWTVSDADGLTRAIFVASTRPLDNDLLVEGLLDHQERS